MRLSYLFPNVLVLNSPGMEWLWGGDINNLQAHKNIQRGIVYPNSSVYRNARCFNSMHASSACYIQSYQGKHVACMGSAGRGSSWPWGDNPKGEVAACNENHTWSWLPCRKEPTSESLLCGSWVRVDMREVSYFSNDGHGQKKVQTTIDRTPYRALAFHTRRGSFGAQEGRDREGSTGWLLLWWDDLLSQPFICLCVDTVCFDVIWQITSWHLPWLPRSFEYLGGAKYWWHKDTHHDFLLGCFISKAGLRLGRHIRDS